MIQLAPRCASSLGGTSASSLSLSAWLDALRDHRSLTALSRASGLPRRAIVRWLKGATQPRLPGFLQLVEATTGRAYELIRELVPGDAGGEVEELRKRRREVWKGLATRG